MAGESGYAIGNEMCVWSEMMRWRGASLERRWDGEITFSPGMIVMATSRVVSLKVHWLHPLPTRRYNPSNTPKNATIQCTRLLAHINVPHLRFKLFPQIHYAEFKTKNTIACFHPNSVPYLQYPKVVAEIVASVTWIKTFKN
jgi:hypothetical protein